MAEHASEIIRDFYNGIPDPDDNNSTSGGNNGNGNNGTGGNGNNGTGGNGNGGTGHNGAFPFFTPSVLTSTIALSFVAFAVIL